MIDKKFLKAVSRNNMASRKDRIIVGFSGGADSSALLHLFHTYKDKLGISLVAAHLDHGIRGRDAKKDEEHARRTAKRFGVEYISGRIDVPAYAKKNKLSLEDAARRCRHDFLSRAAKQAGADRIALAHTADDNVETFLMRMIRGTGMRGLEGIPEVRGRLIRPLLGAWRNEVEDYCRRNKLTFVTDRTNFNKEYTRNRIRLELLPLLAKYNPKIKDSVSRLIGMTGEYQAFIEKASKKTAKGIIKKRTNGIELNKKKLMEQEPAVRSEVIRTAIEGLKGDLTDVSFTNISDILRSAERSNATVNIAGIKVSIGRNVIAFEPAGASDKPLDYELDLQVPGKTVIPEAKCSISASFVGRPDLKSLRLSGRNSAFIDRSKVSRRLVARNWRKGDRFRPLGMKGTKKLQDIFIDQKLDLGDKAAVPVITDGRKIVWVAGYRIDDSVKVGPKTSRVIRLECRRG